MTVEVGRFVRQAEYGIIAPVLLATPGETYREREMR